MRRRHAAAARLERKGDDITPDKDLGNLGRGQDQAMNGFVAHGEGEATQEHVCGARETFQRLRSSQEVGRVLTVHGEESAGREKEEEVHEDVQSKIRVVGAVCEPEDETESHACRTSDSVRLPHATRGDSGTPSAKLKVTHRPWRW